MGRTRWRRLLDIMTRLRGPGGCPWDREQTKETLKKYIVEEAHEVLDAIDRADADALADELGDLLLQIVFQAQLASEAGDFTMDDVLDKITAKLIRRHPHVFGAATVSGPKDVVHNWEEIKKEERGPSGSRFEGIPATLPALRRASRVQQRAANVGFDWSRVAEVLDKIREELDELSAAVAAGDREQAAREIGDVLFSVVNLSRHAGVEAEDALNLSVGKFLSRFEHIERSLAESGRTLEGATLEEMDVLWEAAKRGERKRDRPGSQGEVR